MTSEDIKKKIEKIDTAIEFYKEKARTAYAYHDSMFDGYHDHLKGILKGLDIAREILKEEV